MRAKRFMGWMPLVLGILLGLSLWWGYGQYRMNRTYAIRVENNYQRAFHDLVWHMQTMENELAKLSAAATLEQELERLATVWRQVYAAQDKVGQLPLGTVPLDQTESYLTRAGDFVFNTFCVGQQMTEEQRREVDKLQAAAAKVSEELVSLQSTILQQNVRWTDVEAAMARQGRQNEVRDNSVINSFDLVNRQVQEFPEVQFDQRIGIVQPTPDLKGPRITQAQAQETALWFLSPTNKAAHQVVSVEETQGTIPTYSFVLTSPQADRRVTVDITQNQGRVLWMLDNRTPGEAQLPAASLKQQAEEFLRRRGFNNLRMIGQTEYQNSMLFSYVYVQDGVIIYPDLLRLRVARDTGDVIGFEGNGYTAYHKEQREIPAPKLSEEQALSKLSESLELVGPVQPAIIFNAQGKETLTYELPVRRNNDNFLVYVDSQTGSEMQIVRLDPTELPNQEAAASR